MKPLHVELITDFYQFFYKHMTSSASKKIIESMRDAIRLGLRNWPSIDPFNDIAPKIDIDIDR